MSSEHIADSSLDPDGDPIALAPVIGRAFGQVVFQAAAKSSATITLQINPTDTEIADFSTYFDAGGIPTSARTVRAQFFNIVSGPFEILGPGLIRIRIEATLAGTLANLIAGLNDAALLDSASVQFIATTNVTNPSGDDLKIEQDFDGASPNGKQAFLDFFSLGHWDVTSKNYAGGVVGIDQSLTIEEFFLEVKDGNDHSNYLANSTIKSGTESPESTPIVTVVTGAPIIDEPNIVFDDRVPAGQTLLSFRRITIPPLQDSSTGTSLVSWTANGRAYEVEVTK